jgi:hypothetical protein
MAKKADIEELERGQSDVMPTQDGKPCMLPVVIMQMLGGLGYHVIGRDDERC